MPFLHFFISYAMIFIAFDDYWLIRLLRAVHSTPDYAVPPIFVMRHCFVTLMPLMPFRYAIIAAIISADYFTPPQSIS
jgi:uncharacterized membrane protein